MSREAASLGPPRPSSTGKGVLNLRRQLRWELKAANACLFAWGWREKVYGGQTELALRDPFP